VLSGTTATVAVKVFGPDLDVLQNTGEQVRAAMATVSGVVDLNVEQQTGVPKIAVRFNREALAVHGLNSADLAETIQAAFFGTKVSDVSSSNDHSDSRSIRSRCRGQSRDDA